MPKSDEILTIIETNRNANCDACSAKAKFLVILTTGYLSLCGHHFNKNQKKLIVLRKLKNIVDLEKGSRLN